MDTIVSTVVANGLWAMLFTGLLIYELRDSRRREARYGKTISALTDRLGTVNAVHADTQRLLDDADEIKQDVAVIKDKATKRAAKKAETVDAAIAVAT